MRRLAILVTLSLVAGCVTDQGPPVTSMRGSVVSGSIQVGRVTAPLPTGNWEVIGVGSERNNQNSVLEGVTLAEFRGNQLARAITIVANRDLSPSGWVLFSDCSRTDVHHVSKYSMFQNSQDCYLVNHYIMTRGNNASQHAAQAYDEVVRRVGRQPPTMIGVTWRKADLSKFVNYTYFVNPEVDGFPPATQDWRANDWHRDRIAGDRARQQYVADLVALGDRFRSNVAAGFDNRLPRGGGASPGADPSAAPPPERSPATRLREIEDLRARGMISPAEAEERRRAVLSTL